MYVGTGRYLGANDVSGGSTPEATQQLLLAVKDTGTDLGTLTAAGATLVQQTLDTSVTPRTIPTPQPVNWASQNGWYVNIPLGERVTIEPRLQLGTVSFVANRPVDDYCALGGSSWLYALDYRSGGAITTQANNVAGIQVDSKTIGTGLTIVRLPNGLLVAIVNTPDGTRTLPLPIDAAGAGTVQARGLSRDQLAIMECAAPVNPARRYMRTSADPQVKPPPKASSSTRSPGLMRPSRTPVSSASGTEAAEVLPWSCTVTITRSIGRSSFFATAWMMRMLAWCGTSQLIGGLVAGCSSPAPRPPSCPAWSPRP